MAAFQLLITLTYLVAAAALRRVLWPCSPTAPSPPARLHVLGEAGKGLVASPWGSLVLLGGCWSPAVRGDPSKPKAAAGKGGSLPPFSLRINK